MRYSRQELVLGKESQKIISNKTISIVGLGALGSNSANLISRMGINLILIDYDKVDISNIQRQSIYTENDIGKLKTECAKEYLKKVNSDIKVQAYNKKIDKNSIKLIKSDLILDCTDNLETRFLINEFCHKNKIPFTHAAAIKDKGVVFNVIPGKACFNCIYKFTGDFERCEDIGVLNTITTLISSIQVNEALKILLNKKYETNLIRINLNNNDFEKIKVNKNPRCEICQGKSSEKKIEMKLCKTGSNLSVKTHKEINLDKIKNEIGALRESKNNLLIEYEDEVLVINKDGEITFKKLRDENKIIRIANEILDISQN